MTLYWVCSFCGHPEPAQRGYKQGDKEPCVDCGEGTAKVMPQDEALKLAGSLTSGAIKPVRGYS